MIFKKYFIIIYIIFALALSVFRLLAKDYYGFALSAISPLILLLPKLFYKLLHIPESFVATVFIYTFCILSFTIGMAFYGYKTIPYYDKAVHTLSGVFFAFLGYLTFYALKTPKKILPGDKYLSVYTAFATAESCAALWEIYEYVYSIITKTDPQGVIQSGVTDTMLDIIVCTAGAAVFCIILYLSYTKNRKILFESIINSIIKSKI